MQVIQDFFKKICNKYNEFCFASYKLYFMVKRHFNEMQFAFRKINSG